MSTLKKTGLLIFGSVLSLSANAFEIAQEFSAEAVQSVPGRPSMNVKMFISKKAVRTESTMNGNTLIEIVYPKDKRRVLLNQQRKIYVEQKAQNINAAKSQKISSSPCSGIMNATCKKIGKDKITSRAAVKWEMTAQINGNKVKSLHWLDKKHHMPLRVQLHDGTISTMTLVGKEKINGRNTEKWKFDAIRPNGQKLESLQWYDPKLKMVIREALPGGYVRELKNIKVAKQNKKLFKVPSDYKKENTSRANQQRMPSRNDYQGMSNQRNMNHSRAR